MGTASSSTARDMMVSLDRDDGDHGHPAGIVRSARDGPRVGFGDLARVLAGGKYHAPPGSPPNPLMTPRNLRSLVSVGVLLLALAFALPWTFRATGCLGGAAETCYGTALDACAATFPCKNRGVPFLTVEGACACDCPAPFVGAQCTAEASCPCAANDPGNPRISCLPLSTVYTPLLAAANNDTALLALGLDKRGLALAMTLAQIACRDQAILVNVNVNQRALQLAGSRGERRLLWAKLVVARHMQLSGNYNASRELAVRFADLLGRSVSNAPLSTANITGSILAADPGAVNPGVAQVIVGRIVYDLGTEKISYLPLAELPGPAKAAVEARVPQSQQATFNVLASIATAMSGLRSGFLNLYWTQRLELPLSALDAFRAKLASKSIMVPFDATFPDGGNKANTMARPMGEIHAARASFGSPFCTFMFVGDFQALNAVESATFRVPAFPDQAAARTNCGQRPTYGVLNLLDLRTGSYATEPTQQALVVANATRYRATFSAASLLPRAGNTADDSAATASAERVGVWGALDHVLVEYLMLSRNDSALRTVLAAVTRDEPALVPVADTPPLPAVQIWGGVSTGKGAANAADVDYLVVGLSSRVGESGGVKPDLFFGTSTGQVIRNWAKEMGGKEIRWARDARVGQSVLDPADKESDRAAFEAVWNDAKNLKVTTAEAIWDQLKPKVS
ncbi:hypothetical protein H9P43_007153 [Blastocladiella emersonii ATCC 22665]|nr:hypothetical protein H9P43_007153 [Blastocladiella emersonii ATCC 22665]